MEEEYKTLKIEHKCPNSPVWHVYMNSPSQCNALSRDFFDEFPKALKFLDQNPNVNALSQGRQIGICSNAKTPGRDYFSISHSTQAQPFLPYCSL